jgi:hypothetical protein
MTSKPVTFEQFRSLLMLEFEALTVPEAPPRRIGGEDGAGISFASGALECVARLLTENRIDSKKATEEWTATAIEIASSLFASGGAHHLWRRWAAISAFGSFLCNQIQQSAYYAMLAQEWEFLETLTVYPSTSQDLPAQVIWRLVGGELPIALPGVGKHDYDNAWIALIQSIPSGQHDVTESSLKCLADFWMAELEDWEYYLPGDYPDFDPEICAVASFARLHGFNATSLTADQAKFLEAGLAVSEHCPFYPRLFPAGT